MWWWVMRQRTRLTLAVPDHHPAWQPPLVFEIASASEHGKMYQVTKLASGEWSCSSPDGPCPSFRYRERCRHIDKGRVLAGEVTDLKIPEDLL